MYFIYYMPFIYILYLDINSLYNTKETVSRSTLITRTRHLDLVPSKRSISEESHHYSQADNEQDFI